MNKMFKKILAVVAVMSTAACLSVSAFAAGETATHTDGSVTVGGYAAVSGATQYTVMVFEDSFTTDNDVDKIYYINQGAEPNLLLAGMLVKATDGVNALPVGDYTVRIGNNATGATAVDIDLKVAKDEENDGIVIYWGDVTGDGAFTGADVSAIKMKSIDIAESAKTIKDMTEGSDKTLSLSLGDKVKLTVGDVSVVFYWGDVTGDGAFTGADVSAIKMKSIDIAESAKLIKDITEGSSASVSVSMGDSVTISPYNE